MKSEAQREQEVLAEMLSARNRMSHTCNASNALTVYDQPDSCSQPMAGLGRALDRHAP